MAIVGNQRGIVRGDFEQLTQVRYDVLRGTVIRNVRGRRVDVFGRPIRHQAWMCRSRRGCGCFGMLVVEFLGAINYLQEVCIHWVVLTFLSVKRGLNWEYYYGITQSCT